MCVVRVGEEGYFHCQQQSFLTKQIIFNIQVDVCHMAVVWVRSHLIFCCCCHTVDESDPLQIHSDKSAN